MIIEGEKGASARGRVRETTGRFRKKGSRVKRESNSFQNRGKEGTSLSPRTKRHGKFIENCRTNGKSGLASCKGRGVKHKGFQGQSRRKEKGPRRGGMASCLFEKGEVCNRCSTKGWPSISAAVSGYLGVRGGDQAKRGRRAPSMMPGKGV